MRDLNDKLTGNSLTAAEWNDVPSELQNVIENTGQVLTAADLNQLGKGVAQYAANGNYYTDSGVADAYVLTQIGLKQTTPAYVDGMEVRFIPGNDNTGASTVNVAGLGVKDIRDENDSVLTGGELVSGFEAVLTYSVATGRFRLRRSALGGGAKIFIFTASGTHTTSAGVKAIEFIVTGAGGGGGGVDGQGVGTAAASGSGGAGGTGILNTNSLDASYTITIGAGGAGGAAGNNPGAAGGTTTVSSAGVTITATGGGGGNGATGSGGNSGVPSVAGGTVTGANLNVTGGDASGARWISGELASFSMGGASFWGGSGRSNFNAAGSAGNAYGAGGGGVGSVDDAANYAGGDGADGVVLVREYF